MVATPTLTSISYNGGSLFLSCPPDGADPGYTSYAVTVLGPAGATVAKQTLPILLPIAVSLATTQSYSAAVAYSNGTLSGPASALAPIVSAGPPTIGNLQANSETIVASWPPIAGQSLYYLSAMWDGTLTGIGVAGTTGSLNISPAFGVTAVTVSLCAMAQLTGGGFSYGPSSTVPVTLSTELGASVIYEGGRLITERQNVAVLGAVRDAAAGSAGPTVTQVDYDGQSLAVTWSPLPSASGGYMAYLYGPTAGPSQTTATSATSVVWPGTLSTGSWTVAVAGLTVSGGTTILGPQSAPYIVIQSVPTLTTVSNNTSTLVIGWDAVSDAAGYYVAYGPAGGSSTLVYSSQLSRTLVGGFGQQGTTCAVRAFGSGGVAIGPQSQPITLIVDAPNWMEADYDGASLSLTWTPVTDTNVNGYAVSLQGTSLSYAPGNTGSTTQAVSLSPATAYTAVVYATNGINSGPVANLPLLTAQPDGLWMGFDGQSLCGAWSSLSTTQASINGYTAQLRANGTVVSTPTASSTTATFASGLSSGVVYTWTVRAALDSPTLAVVRGPWSTISNGPFAQATSYTFDSSGRLVTLALGTSAAVQSYAYDAAGNLTTIASTGG